VIIPLLNMLVQSLRERIKGVCQPPNVASGQKPPSQV
jgi:hypothetical protein